VTGSGSVTFFVEQHSHVTRLLTLKSCGPPNGRAFRNEMNAPMLYPILWKHFRCLASVSLVLKRLEHIGQPTLTSL
jgi:hypothetical protein